ncbi:MAG: hypothetical protein ACR2N8_01900 [Parvibaculales bacterium]
MHRNTFFRGILFSLAIISGGFLAAQAGELDVRIHGDNITNVPTPADGFAKAPKFAQTYVYTSFTDTIALGQAIGGKFSLSYELEITGAPTFMGRGSNANKDVIFDDHGLALPEFRVDYDMDYLTLYTGKFYPLSGFDPYSFYGIKTYSNIFHLTMNERLGFGGEGRYDFGDFGQHSLDVSVFMADNTGFSNSLFNKRGRTNADIPGDPSNTGNLDSYSVAISGGNIPLLENFTYRIGLLDMSVIDNDGRKSDENETRFSFAVSYSHNIAELFDLAFMGELVGIDNKAGIKDFNETWLILALRATYEQWHLDLAYIDYEQETTTNNVTATTDAVENIEISIGHDFGNGFTTSIGYESQDVQNIGRTNSFLLLTRYSMSF